MAISMDAFAAFKRSVVADMGSAPVNAQVQPQNDAGASHHGGEHRRRPISFLQSANRSGRAELFKVNRRRSFMAGSPYSGHGVPSEMDTASDRGVRMRRSNLTDVNSPIQE